MIETSRRSFITGLVSFVAAPAIVKASSLMPVKSLDNEYLWRFDVVTGEVYGRSPMMDAIEELRLIQQDLIVYGTSAHMNLPEAPYIKRIDPLDLWAAHPGRQPR